MRRRLFAICLLGVLAVVSVAPFAACSRAETRETRDDLIYSPDGDAKIEAAVAEARRTLPVFWAKLDAAPAGYDAFLLKVGMPVGDGGEEHIWIYDVARADDQITGRLANEPVALKGMAIDDEVKVAADQISDWQYRKGGKLYGHFTTRALFDRANDQQRAEAAELFAPTPLEPEAD